MSVIAYKDARRDLDARRNSGWNTMEKVKKAIQFFLRDLGLHHHHIILTDGDKVEEFSNFTEYGTPQVEIVVCIEPPRQENYGECYQHDPFLVVVDSSLSLLKQLIVLAHELKHVQEYVKMGGTSEESAHKYDIRGLWYGLQLNLISLREYKQLIKTSSVNPSWGCL